MRRANDKRTESGKKPQQVSPFYIILKETDRQRQKNAFFQIKFCSWNQKKEPKSQIRLWYFGHGRVKVRNRKTNKLNSVILRVFRFLRDVETMGKKKTFMLRDECERKKSRSVG